MAYTAGIIWYIKEISELNTVIWSLEKSKGWEIFKRSLETQKWNEKYVENMAEVLEGRNFNN